MKIWILQGGKDWESAYWGGYYLTAEEALLHPMIKEWGFEVDLTPQAYQDCYNWSLDGTGEKDGDDFGGLKAHHCDRWLSLRAKEIGNHLVIGSQRACDKLGIELAYDNIW